MRFLIVCALLAALAASAQNRRGDFNNDGQAHVDDVVRLANHLNDRHPLPLPLRLIGDLNTDNVVDDTDLQLLADAVAGTYQLLPYLPPTLNGLSEVTGDQDVTLSGTTMAGAQVTVSDGTQRWQVGADAGGAFSLSVPVTPGTTTVFSVFAEEGENQTTERFFSVRHDDQPPHVVIQGPGHLEVVEEARYVVSGYAWDASSGIERVTVNGLDAIVQQSAHGTVTWSVVIPLVQGVNLLTAVATDGVGIANTQTQAVVFQRRTGPRIQPLSPREITGVSGVPLSEPLVVRLSDADGGVVRKWVSFELISGSGVLSASPTIAADATSRFVQAEATAGVAMAYFQPGPGAGRAANIVEARSQSLGRVRFFVHTVANGDASITILEGDTQMGPLGAPAVRTIRAYASNHGDPIAGLPVSFKTTSEGAWFGTTEPFITGEDGIVEVTALLGAQGVTVEVSAGTHSTVGPIDVALTGLLQGAGQTQLTATVIDTNDEPVTGVELRLTQPDGVVSATTDALGEVTLDVARGAGILEVVGRGNVFRKTIEITDGIVNALGPIRVSAAATATQTVTPGVAASFALGTSASLHFSATALAASATLSVEELPVNRLPGLDAVAANFAFSIHPVEATFAESATLEIANASGYAPGRRIPLLHYSADYQRWQIADVMVASEDGLTLSAGRGIAQGGEYVLAAFPGQARAVGCTVSCEANGGTAGALVAVPAVPERTLFNRGSVATVVLDSATDDGGAIGLDCRDAAALAPVGTLASVVLNGPQNVNVPLAVEHDAELQLDLVRFGGKQGGTYTLTVTREARRGCEPASVESTQEFEIVNCSFRPFSCEGEAALIVLSEAYAESATVDLPAGGAAVVSFRFDVSEIAELPVSITWPERAPEAFQYKPSAESLRVEGTVFQVLNDESTVEVAAARTINTTVIEAEVTEPGRYFAVFDVYLDDSCLRHDCPELVVPVTSGVATVRGTHLSGPGIVGSPTVLVGEDSEFTLSVTPAPSGDEVITVRSSSPVILLNGQSELVIPAGALSDSIEPITVTATVASTALSDVVLTVYRDDVAVSSINLTAVELNLAAGPFVACKGAELTIPLTFKPQVSGLLATATVSGPGLQFKGGLSTLSIDGSDGRDEIVLDATVASAEEGDHTIRLFLNTVEGDIATVTVVDLEVTVQSDVLTGVLFEFQYSLLPDLPGTVFELFAGNPGLAEFPSGGSALAVSDGSGTLAIESLEPGTVDMAVSFGGTTCFEHTFTISTVVLNLTADLNGDSQLDQADEDLEDTTVLTFSEATPQAVRFEVEAGAEASVELSYTGTTLWEIVETPEFPVAIPLPRQFFGSVTEEIQLIPDPPGAGELILRAVGSTSLFDLITFDLPVQQLDLRMDLDRNMLVDVADEILAQSPITLSLEAGSQLEMQTIVRDGSSDALLSVSPESTATFIVRDLLDNQLTLPFSPTSDETSVYFIEFTSSGQITFILSDQDSSVRSDQVQVTVVALNLTADLNDDSILNQADEDVEDTNVLNFSKGMPQTVRIEVLSEATVELTASGATMWQIVDTLGVPVAVPLPTEFTGPLSQEIQVIPDPAGTGELILRQVGSAGIFDRVNFELPEQVLSLRMDVDQSLHIDVADDIIAQTPVTLPLELGLQVEMWTIVLDVLTGAQLAVSAESTATFILRDAAGDPLQLPLSITPNTTEFYSIEFTSAGLLTFTLSDQDDFGISDQVHITVESQE